MTTAYIRSPERLLGEARSSAAIDLWACGVVAWCMATGECAWLLSDGVDVLLAYNTLLGRASPDEWPGIRDMPRYAEFEAASGRQEPIHGSEMTRVANRLGAVLLDLAQSLLRWSPAARS